MGFLDKLRGRQSQPPPTSPPQLVQGVMVSLDIVGEASYVDNVRSVKERYGDAKFAIRLRPDPANAYDPNCVDVWVDDQQVGHLSRRMAKDWQAMIIAAEGEGFWVVGRAQATGDDEGRPNIGVFGQAPWPGQGRPPDKYGR